MLIIIPHDQNVILKPYIINQRLQNFNPQTNFLICLIFLTLLMFTTLLHHSQTTQTILFDSTNYKRPIEVAGPNMIHNHNREKVIVFFYHYILLQMIKIFNAIRIEQSCSTNPPRSLWKFSQSHLSCSF